MRSEHSPLYCPSSSALPRTTDYRVGSSDDIFRHPACQGIVDAEQEHAIALYLNTQNEVLDHHTVSIGCIDRSFLEVRSILRHAIRLNARHFALAHNHPSGACEPSGDDIRSAATVAAAGYIMDIPLLDFLVVSPAGYSSLLDQGFVPKSEDIGQRWAAFVPSLGLP